ncbi:winged helix-turn-helix domain-containing protein [Sphingopyxis sp. GW247-27LB]|uniref:protein kinase domain-containing protein n=1 Tax=Sphingopyxis sp. GW247-27LB TaxID=2012632 RepID=UPI000BA62B4B|nr:winged helix-turn-helix domain-containing protein [Sphingopyxis sp. GW247-27LB]PAL22407.1 hypothetical protein CD928_09905 [Sphingopyxis sp. GW247-27LB]
MSSTHSSRRRRRLWRFASAEFDEASWVLRVGGAPAAVEGKPLEVLHELLLRAGEVVTKDEILDAVWPGVTVVEGSLATAISKLRKALGATDSQSVIATVSRVGYRFVAPVEVTSIDTPLAPRFAFASGDAVPARKAWQLERPLGDSGSEDVWLARQTKTGEARIFKFADAPDRLRALKREAALSRLVFAALGKAAPLPTLHEWNFDAPPFFLEYAWGGRDLLAWAEESGGLAAIPLEDRLAVAAMIARAVAGIHGVGILHKDLKPANILIDEVDGSRVVRLVDFGSGRLLDEALLASFDITDPGSLDADLGKDEPRSGTLAYRAPELVGDAVPTVKSDIYALGLILYQLVAGDFSAALAPGWEGKVADPLIEDDIGRAAAGAPDARLGSASELADRLGRLDERRTIAARAAEQTAFLAEQKRQEERRVARRPWVRAAAASLIVGLVGTSAFAAYAVKQRNEARAAQQISEASYRFLAEDVLASVDPAHADAAGETLVAAVNRAGGTIGQRFEDQPRIAGYLYATLARAFDLRSDYADAFRYYEAAERSYDRAGSAGAAEGVNVRLQHASALALSTQPGSLDAARGMIAAAARTIAAKGIDSPETTVWLESARGMAALAGEDVPGSRDHFGRAWQAARTQPELFSPRQIVNFGQRHAFALIRLGEGAAAEKAFRPLVAEMTKLVGRDHPDTLFLRLNVGQALMVQQRFPEAIAVFDALLPVMERRLGPNHRYTLLLLAARQQSLGGVGRYADAAADGERVWRAAAAKDGPSSFAAVAGRTDIGISQCRAGKLDQGIANIRAARAAMTRGEALAQAIDAALADCLIQAHRYAEAKALLRTVDPAKVAQLVGDPHYDALVDLAFAEIALGERNPAEARRLFAKAGPDLKDTQDRFVQDRIKALEARLTS